MAQLINEQIVNDYSKKVFGFSMRKTGNVYDAQDLSQEILVSLIDALDGHRQIADMNAYIYTICCYTWSKFLRRNKRPWSHLSIDFIEVVEDGTKMEDVIFQSMDIKRLKKEIGHLAYQHRMIVTQFYFENQSCEEIANSLGMSNERVRWHLYEIRRKLKEGFFLTQNPNITPKRLWSGHDGNITAEKMQVGLGVNLLVDNIVLACYGNPLTIEEISRELGVAAAYLEFHVNELLYMDYIRVVNKNRFQANIFIREPKHGLITAKYHYENIGPIAEAIYKSINERFEEIRALGYVGNHLDRDFLLWSLLPLYTGQLFWEIFNPMAAKSNALRPKRKDGSAHWVCAGLVIDDSYYDQCDEPKEIVDFVSKSSGNGIKTRSSDLGVNSLQLDTYACIKKGIHWREFNGTELNSLYRIKYLLQKDEEPNENDKLEIARLIELGYVKMNNNTPEILIPFFDKEQYTRLMAIFSEVKASLGNPFAEYIEGYAKIMDAHIPDFISREERYHVTHSIYPQYAVLFHLVDRGLLRYPSDEEVKRLATIVWLD